MARYKIRYNNQWYDPCDQPVYIQDGDKASGGVMRRLGTMKTYVGGNWVDIECDVKICNSPVSFSGGYAWPDPVVTEFELGETTGIVVFNYDAASVPDKFEVVYDGAVVASTPYVGRNEESDELEDITGERVEGYGHGYVQFNKNSATVKSCFVRTYGPFPTTGWFGRMYCPGNIPQKASLRVNNTTTGSVIFHALNMQHLNPAGTVGGFWKLLGGEFVDAEIPTGLLEGITTHWTFIQQAYRVRLTENGSTVKIVNGAYSLNERTHNFNQQIVAGRDYEIIIENL